MRLLKTLCLAIVISMLAPANSVAQTVDGFVDLHSHLMAEHSFGGSWFWGSIEGQERDAVRRCDGNFLTQSHAATRWPLVSELVSPYDSGWHLGKRRGYDQRRCRRFLGIPIPGTCPRPHYAHWPDWEAKAHQQMWEGWLRDSHDDGLSVMVVSLAESNFLCINTPPLQRRYDCDEMNSVIRQAEFANAFAEQNSTWVGIARSSSEARQLAAQGKLALVLAVEVTKLFPSGEYVSQLDELYDLGVRSVQLAHHADSRFSGAAPLPELKKTVNLIEILWGITFGPWAADITDIDEIICRNQFGAEGDCDGESYLNQVGLTADGEKLVQLMMERGMLLDVAHMSRKAFADTYAEAMANSAYPLLYSHVHLWETIQSDEDKTHHEKYLMDSEFDMIKDTQGMIGLRTGPEKTHHYKNPEVPSLLGGIINCQGSGRSFAQSLMYAVDNGLSVGFGADLNGFIEQSKPCFAVNNSNQLREHGLAHVGLLPALMQDMRDAGVPNQYLDHLDNSAETFLQMWERAESLATVVPPPEPPVATCSANPRSGLGISSLNVTLSAVGSYSPGGAALNQYEWDFGDGYGFGYISTTPVITHWYFSVDGQFRQWNPKVRVYDEFGQMGEADCGIVFVAP